MKERDEEENFREMYDRCLIIKQIRDSPVRGKRKVADAPSLDTFCEIAAGRRV